MSFELQPFEIKVRKRSTLGQYWAIMGYLFGLVREIDPRLKYAIDTFTLIGLLYVLKTIGSLTCTAFNGFRVFVWSRLVQIDLKKRYGEWAVITGATDGVGLEYARQLAQRGHSLILVGRNQEKLEQVKQELSAKLSPERIQLVQVDLAEATLETYKRVETEINSLERDVGILINNAGVMYKSPNLFLEQSDEDDWNQITVNCTGLTLMTRTCLPGMVKRKRGLIINLSSVAGYRPLPLMGVYSASKKYVEYFSKTLQTEYRQFNIEVQVLTPNYISTKMTSWSETLQKPNFIFPNANSFVRSAIATIGRSNNTSGFWSHGLQVFFYEWFVPDWMYTLSSWRFLKTLDSSNKAK